MFIKRTFYYDQENSGFHLHRQLLIDEAFIPPSGEQLTLSQVTELEVEEVESNRPKGIKKNWKATSVN